MYNKVCSHHCLDIMECRFLLIAVFVFLCQTLIFSVALPLDLLEIDEYGVMNCSHKGVIHDGGEKWGEHCQKYHCVKGSVKILHEGCEFQGHCKKAGVVWNHHCMRRTCINQNGKFHVKLLESRCQGKGHHCHKLGATWHEKHQGQCQVRKCVKVHKAFVAKKLDAEC